MIWQPLINHTSYFLGNLIDSFMFKLFIPEQLFNAFHILFGYLGYFFPIAQLMPIIRISIALSVWRFGIAIFRFIKGLIPTMGG